MKKFISALITIILIAWVGLFAYDYYRASKNEAPTIVLKEEEHQYTILGYKYITYNRKSKMGYEFGGFWLKVKE